MGVAGFPASSGTSQTGITRFSQTSGQGVMDVFQNGSAGAGFQVTNSSNLSLSYPFIINPNGGNVLIGTTSDNGAKFQVSGTATFSSDLTVTGIYRDYQGEALLQTNGSDTLIGSGGATTGRTLKFYAGNSIRLTIASTGAATFSGDLTANVGTITFTNAANVYMPSVIRNGATGKAFFQYDGTDTRLLKLSTGLWSVRNDANNANLLTITDAGAVTIPNLAGVGSRTVNADANGVLSAASDSRLKQEILDYKVEGLAEILKIQPRAYKWLSDIENRGKNAATEIGFFANEVASIIPSAAPMGNDGYYGFYDRAVIAALVNSVKELNARIIQLEN
jgi:hypothetical protein